jgi:glycosyltransferase involved in cell wall biosynthesis
MNERPNLTYLISSLETGGAEIGMVRLLQGLPPDKFDIKVVALHGGNQTVVDDIPPYVEIVDLNISSKLFLHRLFALVPILRSSDIVVGSIYHAEIVARLFGSITGVDTLVTWAHNTRFKTSLRRWVDKRTIGLCDAVLADSSAVGTMLVEQQGVDPDKVWIVPIAGIPVDDYENRTLPLRDLSDSVVGGEPLDNVDESATIIGIAGNLIESKNHDAVLDVASRLSDQNVHITIAGDGPRREELKNAISKRNLTNVSMLGYVDSIPEYLSTVDIYFQPSHYEGLCITVVEAMAAGKPIVASDAGEIPNNIAHGEHGFVTSPDDIDGFEEYITILVNNPSLRAEMGAVAQDRAENKYSRKTLSDRFLKVIETIHLNA